MKGPLDGLTVKLSIFWFVLSSLVVVWDVAFVLLRPWTFPGGYLHLLWKPCKPLKVKYVLPRADLLYQELLLDQQSDLSRGGLRWSTNGGSVFFPRGCGL
jgi:hypothetical protein